MSMLRSILISIWQQTNSLLCNLKSQKLAGWSHERGGGTTVLTRTESLLNVPSTNLCVVWLSELCCEFCLCELWASAFCELAIEFIFPPPLLLPTPFMTFSNLVPPPAPANDGQASLIPVGDDDADVWAAEPWLALPVVLLPLPPALTVPCKGGEPVLRLQRNERNWTVLSPS